jgi:cystathionine gamma-synthase
MTSAASKKSSSYRRLFLFYMEHESMRRIIKQKGVKALVKTETLLAQLGNRSDQHTGTVNPPVYFSTAYRHEGIGQSNGYDYVRTGNPTREILEQAIASLEQADQGYACSSGMSAISTVLSLFRSGDELVVSKDLYGGTYRLLEQGFAKWGLVSKYADTSDIDAVSRQITPQTKAIFLETPTNPLMQQADIEAVAAIARQHGILLIVDNTFYTPVLQQPIRLGADIVIHSATKYLGGHNDVLAGLIAARGEELCASLALHHNAGGAVLSPFDSWLLMRGMKTLALRMKKHESNAVKLADYLSSHECVEEVLYPGKGGMLSFRVCKEKWAGLFLQNLNLITFAESLGGTESFITYPATQTHADIPEETRLANGICNKLLRFSVGIEDPGDLMEDLEQAFSACMEGVNIR